VSEWPDPESWESTALDAMDRQADLQARAVNLLLEIRDRLPPTFSAVMDPQPDDAERWNWFRAHWRQLTFTSDGTPACGKITYNAKLAKGDEPSLDAAIDQARALDP
jgi:hypothetical protein